MQFPNSSSPEESNRSPCSSLETTFKAGGMTFIVPTLFASTVGNSLVCLAVYRQPSLRTTSNAFIVNLAVTDIVASNILIPLEALYLVYFPGVPLSGPAINAWNTLFLCFLVSSILNFTAVSVDRYIRIVFPMRYDRVMTSSLGAGLLGGIWVYSSALAVLMYFAFETPEDGIYSFQLDNRFFISFLSIGVVLPFCVIVILYFKIFRLSRHHNHRIFILQPLPFENSTQMTLALKRSTSFLGEVRSAKTIGIVICCFVVTWFPFLVYQLIFMFMDQSDCTLDKLDTVTCWLTYLSGVLNPVTYAARDSNFRRAFRRIITCS